VRRCAGYSALRLADALGWQGRRNSAVSGSIYLQGSRGRIFRHRRQSAATGGV